MILEILGHVLQLLGVIRNLLQKHKHYKQNYASKGMSKRGNKKGQLVIFVIVAIVIVAIVLVVSLFPGLQLLTTDVSPSSFLRNCIESDVRDFTDVLSKQGGYIEPDNYVLYEGEKIQYLCYTAEDYRPCVVQQPLLVKHVEEEIKDFVEPRARQCVKDLEEQYERRGYTVETTPGDISVSIIPSSIVIDFISPMSVTKESTQTFRKFAVSINSEWYDLLLTAVSIVQFESTLGDSETTLYIQYYPDLSIDKIKRADEGTIYKLSNVVTGDEFTFASRSLNWPTGYGFENL